MHPPGQVGVGRPEVLAEDVLGREAEEDGEEKDVGAAHVLGSQEGLRQKEGLAVLEHLNEVLLGELELNRELLLLFRGEGLAPSPGVTRKAIVGALDRGDRIHPSVHPAPQEVGANGIDVLRGLVDVGRGEGQAKAGAQALDADGSLASRDRGAHGGATGVTVLHSNLARLLGACQIRHRFERLLPNASLLGELEFHDHGDGTRRGRVSECLAHLFWGPRSRVCIAVPCKLLIQSSRKPAASVPLSPSVRTEKSTFQFRCPEARDTLFPLFSAQGGREVEGRSIRGRKPRRSETNATDATPTPSISPGGREEDDPRRPKTHLTQHPSATRSGGPFLDRRIERARRAARDCRDGRLRLERPHLQAVQR